MLNGGVFGFGGVGQGMTRSINNSSQFREPFRITAVCNRGKEKRDLAEREYGLKAYSTVDELIDHGIDFMLIVSTSQAHKEAALKCCEAGIPYLIEKPIALTEEDGQAIVDATEKKNLINGVNYTMRYQPVYKKLKELADSGELGTLLSVWASVGRGYGFHSSGKRHRAVCEPEESGGWIIHHMCHIVDFVVWVAGEVSEVYTASQSTAPPELQSEEIIYSILRFKNGAVGNLFDQVGMLRDHQAGIIGTKASVAQHFTAPSSSNVKPLLKLSRETDRQYLAPHIIDPMISFELEDGLTHFLTCLKEGRQTNVPVREGLYSLKVCSRMRTSAYEKRPVPIE